MQNFDFNNKQLHSLSQRFAFIFKSDQAHNRYQDNKINVENLQFGLANFLANLMNRMTIEAPTTELLQAHINSFNSDHRSDISFNDFDKLAWVRIVNDEILIPSTISNTLYSVFDSERKDTVSVPEAHLLKLKCLYEFEKKYDQAKPSIGIPELEVCLKFSSSSSIKKQFLIERNIIEESNNGRFIWKSNEYTRFLQNEIAASLWLIIIYNKEEPQITDFKIYLRLLQRFDIWVNNLSKYITYQQISKLQELAFQFLISEPDLDNSPQEIAKAYWDAPLYQHRKIDNSAPIFEFTELTAYKLIQQADYFESLHQDLFDYQQSRSIYGLAIRFLLFDTTPESGIFNCFTNLFNSVQKPYLVLEAFDIMKRESFVLPYLLLNLQTAPIFFHRLLDLDINSSILKTQDYLQQPTEAHKLKSSIWMEAFQYLLEKIREEKSFEKLGYVIAQVLDQASIEVFKYRSQNPGLSIISHNSAKHIFDFAWQLLKNFRDVTSDSSTDNGFRSRLIARLLPSLIEEFLEFKQVPWLNEFIHLNLHRTATGIEILKASDTLLLFGEVNNKEHTKQVNYNRDITKSIYKLLIGYFTKEETYIIDFLGNTQSMRVKRGINDFGIEIVEWAYLFLHFQELNLTNILDETFKESLLFDNTEEKEYSDLNREQYEKLRIYLTILSLAHKGLVKELSSPNITMLPASDTVKFLENTIRYYALLYNRVDLPNNRIDIFDETRYSFRSDLQQLPLSLHLYESINLFQYENKVHFVQSFFEFKNHLGQLLSALNRFDSTDVKEVVSARLSAIDVEGFIKDAKTVTDLENTLIEVVNSDNHFDKATLLLLRVEKHLEKVKLNDDASRQFLFRIRLLLAFKNKDEEQLKILPIPESNYRPNDNFEYFDRKRNYFLALHNLYNLHQYEDAIEVLQNISTQEPHNIDFAFHLYRARLQKAITA